MFKAFLGGGSGGSAHRGEQVESPKAQADHDDVILSIEEISKELHHKKDTLHGEKRPFVFDAGSFRLMKATELQAVKERLEIELEEIAEQEESRSRVSFERSPFGRRSADFGVAGARQVVDDAEVLYGAESDLGLRWDRRFHGYPSGPANEDVRRKRREGTKKKVSEELRAPFGKEVHLTEEFKGVGQHTVLFSDNSRAVKLSNIAAAGGSFLLGRYDVCVTKVWADLDRNWDFIKGTKNHFWIAHAAALNIGESAYATDFYDFCSQDNNTSATKLSEEAYLQAMEHIMMNIVYAANYMSVEHLIFFPFGMGAFLRHLGSLDARYAAWQELQRLRRALASTFIRVLATTLHARASVYLCLMFGDVEPQCNSDAFLRALVDTRDESVKALRQRVVICSEGDCLHLAQELGANSNNVMLVNGANRQLLGNHWFDGHAKRAIDENMHRRSWRMAATSYLLNNYGRRIRQRNPDDLQNNVRAIGGTVHEIRWHC